MKNTLLKRLVSCVLAMILVFVGMAGAHATDDDNEFECKKAYASSYAVVGSK